MDDVIDPNASKAVAMTSLDWCARSHQVSLLQTVLRAHFPATPISTMQPECSLLLRHAVTSGCHETVTSLLGHVDQAFLQQAVGEERDGAVKTRVDKLLGLSVEHGHRNVAEVLLSRGGNPNSWYRGQPVLHLALSLGHCDLALALLDAGADIHLAGSKGETAIFPALSTDSDRALPVVDRLIRDGADVSHRTATGRQPIHVAAFSSSPACLARLLEAGCDVSAQDGVQGDTPLHLACSRCCQAAVVTLVQHGAGFNPPNHHGHTPLRRLLQHATRAARESHDHMRISLARTLVTIGFTLEPDSRPDKLLSSSSREIGSSAGVLSSQNDGDQPDGLDIDVSYSPQSGRNRDGPSDDKEVDHKQVSARELPFIALLQSFTAKSFLSNDTSQSSQGKPSGLPFDDCDVSFSGSSGVVLGSPKTAAPFCSDRAVPTSSSRIWPVGISGAEPVSPSRAVAAGTKRSVPTGASRAASPSSRRPCRRDKVAGVVQGVTTGLPRGVSSLQHYCRLEIRRHLPSWHFQQAVGQLELAPHLHHYLMFKPRLVDSTCRA